MEVVTSSTDEVLALKLTIEGMRAKLNEAKRFKAQYQAMKIGMDRDGRLMTRIRRENQRLRRALAEVALARSGTTSVKNLASYAGKVLSGLGFNALNVVSDD